MLNKRTAVIIAGLFGFLAVAVGAFGAHSLSDRLSESMASTFRTGSLYHLIHSSILVILAFHFEKKLEKSFIFFALGIILFSFSLYFYAVTGIRFLAYIKPFGGVSFLIGWLMLLYYGLKKKRE